MIVAVSENNVIGRDGDLPWRLSRDLKRFKQLTMGHHLIMGRKTLESIGRLLPGRQTVVVTRQSDFSFDGALIARSIEAALETVAADDQPFVVGGREIYQQLLPFTETIYRTCVLANVLGDTTFDPLDEDVWELREAQSWDADERTEFPHRFEQWTRRQ